MIVDKINLLWYFYSYNNEYFNGILPIPKLKIMHSYRKLGFFSCDGDGYHNFYNYEIKISDNYDYTEHQLRNVLVHEMVHYYLVYTKKDVNCKHGKEFKKMCITLNDKYGMTLSKRINTTKYKLRKGKSKLMYKLCTLF